jgi:hypothetical protein
VISDLFGMMLGYSEGDERLVEPQGQLDLILCRECRKQPEARHTFSLMGIDETETSHTGSRNPRSKILFEVN